VPRRRGPRSHRKRGDRLPGEEPRSAPRVFGRSSRRTGGAGGAERCGALRCGAAAAAGEAGAVRSSRGRDAAVSCSRPAPCAARRRPAPALAPARPADHRPARSSSSSSRPPCLPLLLLNLGLLSGASASMAPARLQRAFRCHLLYAPGIDGEDWNFLKIS
jgi:hypothetical protein